MSLVDDLAKEFGLSDENQDVSQWLDTGLLPLNKIISGRYDGGFPVGRISEVYGLESCGKTAIATVVMAETQKRGGFAVFLDYEHSFSLSRAKTLGLQDQPDQWLYKQPTTAEEGFLLVERIIELVRKHSSDRMITIVIDSVASMMTQSQVDASFGKANMHTMISLPRVLSGALPKLAKLINDSNVTLILLNQIRDNVSALGYGEKTKTPGGNAVRFYCSVRIQLTKIGKLEKSGAIYGERIKAFTRKNKVAPPLKDCVYNFNFETGVDFATSHIESAKDAKLIEASGGWVPYKGKKRRIGELVEHLNSNPDEYAEFLGETFKD